MKRAALAFDVGGTYIKYGVVDDDGEIHVRGKAPTPKLDCGVAVVEYIIETSRKLIMEYSGRFRFEGVGVSTAGIVDSAHGILIGMNENMPGYTGAQIGSRVYEGLGLRCEVDNDVNCAAAGESWLGVANGESSFVMIALGTGIGMGIYINGGLYRGKNGFAGEIGHMTINENGLECPCGMTGCFERYGSTLALIEGYNAESEGVMVSAEEIFELVESGDPLADKIFGRYIKHLVTGLINVTYTLDPGLIVLGGGISEQGERLTSSVVAEFQKRCQRDFADKTKIVHGKLGNDAALVGGANMIFQIKS